MPTVLRRVLPMFWAVLTVGVVAAVVWVGLGRLPASSAVDAGTASPAPATRPATLLPGRDYYVLVKLVEFNPRKPDGAYWDRGTNTTPDPKVVIAWRGQDVFTLPTRDDQFIATWDLFRVNLKDVAMSGGNVDIASSINAPLVRCEPGESLTIRVYDADVFRDDLAAVVTVPLTELRLGESDLPVAKTAGIRRLVVQTIDRETPLSALIDLASKR